MYISWIPITHITNSGLNSKAAFHIGRNSPVGKRRQFVTNCRCNCRDTSLYATNIFLVTKSFHFRLKCTRRTCDSRVGRSSPGVAPLRSGPWQAAYTCVPLSANSITWYRPMGVISLAGKVTAGLVFTSMSLCARFQVSVSSGYDLWHHLMSQTDRRTDLQTDGFCSVYMNSSAG